MPIDFPDHPFWDFSIEVYDKEGVAPACLALQEAHRLDINVLLWCLWLGASGRGRASQEQVGQVLETVEPWHEAVVRGMRAIRRRMKEGVSGMPAEYSEPLRKRVAALEIQCEHAEQIALAGAIERAPDESAAAERRARDAVANAACYFADVGASLSADDRGQLAIIAAAAIPDLDAEAIARLCKVPAAA